MEPAKFKVLKEITPDAGRFSLPVKNRLHRMLSGISTLYLSAINYQFKLKYTDTLLFYVENSDQATGSKDVFHSLGNENTPAGATKAWLSEKDFLQLNDQDKRTKLLEIFHNTLKGYGESIDLLERAYRASLSSDFYYNRNAGQKSKDGKYNVQIQAKENWGDADNRLKVTDLSNGEVKYYSLKTTTYPFFDEMPGLNQQNMWEVVLNTPQIFDPIKWDRGKYVAYWGKEKFIFDPKTEKLTIEMTK